MDIKNIPPVIPPEDIIENAIKRAHSEKDPVKKIQIVGDKVAAHLEKIVKSFPNFNELNKFYKELLETYYPIARIKKALAGVDWLRRKVMELKREYIKKAMKDKKRAKEIRKAFYGRVFSMIRDLAHEFEFLEDVRKVLREFPVIKEMPTVIIFGFPNVGKSSLLRALTGSEPEIAEYPFTTKKILIGYIDKKIQVIDTPGVLVRKKKNQIERRALITLENLGDLIVYVFDPSETCGFPVKDQIKLYEETKKLGKPMIIVANKCDLWKKFDFDEKYIKTSCESGEGIETLKKKIYEFLRAIRNYESVLF